MKTTVIVILMCVNVALLAALALGSPGKAHGQVYGGGNDYLMITGQIASNYDAVYIIDMKKRQLRGWEFNRSRKRLVPIGQRDLRSDFRRTEME